MAAPVHPVFKAPANQSAALWRYMDFTKFVSLLESKSLFFARADLLGDPFEGSYSRGNELLRPQLYKDIPPESLAKMFSDGASFARWLRQWTFISCWHMNETESAAMWKLYAKSNEAVAIKTTFAALASELDNKTYLGEVQYIDFEKDRLPEGNSFYPYVHKRLSFAHEHEVRAVIQELPIANQAIDRTKPPIPGGVSRPVNLAKLIGVVHVAPTCPQWFGDLVETICRRYKLSVPVKQSSLDAEPFF